MAIKIPENTLPVRDLENGDYIRVVGADGKSYRVPSESVGGGGDAGTVTYDPEGEYDEGTVGSALQNAEEDITDAKADLTDLEQNKADIIVSSASGSIAHFEDGAAYPVKELVAHIEPVQSGTGDPSPDNVRPISGHTGCEVVRTGANVWDEEWEAGTLNASTGAEVDSNVTMRSKNFIRIKPGMEYIPVGPYNVISTNQFIICYYDKDGAYVGSITPSRPESFVVPSDERIASMRFAYRYYLHDSGGAYNHDVSVNYPSTDTAYHAYNPNSHTYPITFPSEAGTVYGGYVDVTQGKLVVTDANIASYSGETLPSTWISDRDVYAEGTTPTTGAQVVYKLATPITYDLTPQQISTLLGTNNIWADTGDTTVEYRADTKLYIEQLTKPTEDDMTANTTIQSGKFFMVGNRLFLSTATIASGDTINPGTNCTELSLADALNSL